MDVAGIVLAGGLSRRLGRDKAVERVGGQHLIARVIDRLSLVVDEVVVVVADMRRSAELPLPDSATVVADIYPDSGSLGGIFTGLTTAKSPWGIVVACDMPFLNEELLRHLLDSAEGHDAVVPVLNGRPEPTHALYAKACLPHMEERLRARELKIAPFMDHVRVNYVDEDVIGSYDPDHLSFFNVNTPADLDRALELVEAGH